MIELPLALMVAALCQKVEQPNGSTALLSTALSSDTELIQLQIATIPYPL